MDEENGENKIESIRNIYGKPSHYYGDVVRKLFVLNALIMLGTLPFLVHRIPTPSFIAIILIIIIASAAGFMSPRNKIVISLDFIISALGLFAFEYYAVHAYTQYSPTDTYFLTNQLIAIVFLFALYYASKTLRSFITDTKSK